MSVKYNGKTIAGKYKAQLVDTSNFATKEEIPTDFYTQAEVNTLLKQKANTSDIPNVSNFITMSDVEAKGYLTEHQDISNLATKEELATKQDTLTAGENITIENGVISASGGAEIDTSNLATKTDVANKQDKFTTSLPLTMGGLKTSTTNISYDNNGKAYLNDVAYYATIEDCLPTEPLSNYEKRRSFFDDNYTNSECKFRFYKLKGYTEQYPILNLDGYNSILRNFEVGDIVMSDSITPYSGDYNDVELCFGKIEDDGTFIPKLMCMTYGWSDSARFAKVVYLNSPNESYKYDRDWRNSTAFIANYTNNESRIQLLYKNASGIANIGNIRGVKFIEKNNAVTIAWVYENGEVVELSDIGTFDKIDFNCVLFTGFVFDNSEVTDTGIYGFDSSKYYVAKDTIDNVVVRMTDGTGVDSLNLKYSDDFKLNENNEISLNADKIPTMPIGQIISVNANDSYVPDGTLPCDGAEYSREQFPDLWDNYLINGLLNTVSIAEWLEEVGPDKGNCTKFGIDIYSETFRVPLINKVLTDIADTVDVIGNGKAIGLTDGTSEGALCGVNASSIGYKATSYGKTVPYTDSGAAIKNNNAIALTSDARASGIIADTTNVKTYSELRYFVVVANGQTNQSLMDWSAWASSLQSKANADLSNCTNPIVSAPYIVESFIDGTSGYNLYSNGYCEQWGVVGETTTSGYPKNTVTLLKEYRNKDEMNVQVTGRYTATASASSCFCYERTTNTISIIGIGYGCDWVTKGYIN